MSWQVEKALDDLMAQETGAVQYPFGTRHAMAICYPNTYDVAMSNLGMQIIYREVNGREDWLCERVFLPDKDLMKVFDKTGEPLISLENRRPLSDFEILGLSVSFEIISMCRLSWKWGASPSWPLTAMMTIRSSSWAGLSPFLMPNRCRLSSTSSWSAKGSDLSILSSTPMGRARNKD